jgi:F-type H+-transporting ATPase subunit b
MEHFLNETVVVAIAFLVFIPLVFKPVKKAVLTMLDERAAVAVKVLKEAEELHTKAQMLLKEAEEHYATALKDSKDIVQKASEEAHSILDEANKEVERIVKKKTELSIVRISQQERQIVDDIKSSAIQLAVSQIQDSIMDELGKEAQISLIENGIKEAKKLLN